MPDSCSRTGGSICQCYRPKIVGEVYRDMGMYLIYRVELGSARLSPPLFKGHFRLRPMAEHTLELLSNGPTREFRL